MGSQHECTRILGLDGFRVERIEWEGGGLGARVCVWIERKGIRGYECSGCRRHLVHLNPSTPAVIDPPETLEIRVSFAR